MRVPVEVSGLTMYQAIPARWVPPSGFNAVSRAPHSLPFAYMTCCMRVSLESGVEMTSLWAGCTPKSNRQHPTPAMVGVVVSSIQKPCGASMVANEPEPGCRCLGGIPYWPTVNTLVVRVRFGDPVLSEEVLVSAQTIRLVEAPVYCVPDASSPALELRKYSVPPAFGSYEFVPGDCAGHTVKPGCVCTVGEVAWTFPVVSMCTIVTFVAPAASCCLDSA